MSTHEQSTEELLAAVIDGRIARINTALPATVESYDSTNNTVAVIVPVRHSEDAAYPKLSGIPLVFPRFTNGGLRFPINKGDGVLILFIQQDIDKYLMGSSGEVSMSQRKFSISDAVAIPGLFPLGNPPPNASEDSVELSYGSSRLTIEKNGKIKLIADSIELGDGLGNFKKLATEDFVSQKFYPHSHIYVNTAGAATPVSTPTDMLMAPMISSPTDTTLEVTAK